MPDAMRSLLEIHTEFYAEMRHLECRQFHIDHSCSAAEARSPLICKDRLMQHEHVSARLYSSISQRVHRVPATLTRLKLANFLADPGCSRDPVLWMKASASSWAVYNRQRYIHLSFGPAKEPSQGVQYISVTSANEGLAWELRRQAAVSTAKRGTYRVRPFRSLHSLEGF